MSSPRQLTLDLIKPAKPSLDNFVVGRNAEVIAALRATASSKDRFVYLWGESGSGRSHLLQAFGLDSERSGVPSFDSRRTLYAVDDVELCSESQQQQLFVLMNEVRANNAARFVGAGSAAPMHLELRDDVRTRLAWGLVYQVHALSDAEKARALTSHAASRGVTLPADVVDYLLTHMPRDMRTLVAIVDALDAFAISLKKAISVALVRLWASDGVAGKAP